MRNSVAGAVEAFRAGRVEECRDWCQGSIQWIALRAAARVAQVALAFPQCCRAEQDAFLRMMAGEEAPNG